jgi:hypothetical protein
VSENSSHNHARSATRPCLLLTIATPLLASGCSLLHEVASDPVHLPRVGAAALVAILVSKWVRQRKHVGDAATCALPIVIAAAATDALAGCAALAFVAGLATGVELLGGKSGGLEASRRGGAIKGRSTTRARPAPRSREEAPPGD